MREIKFGHGVGLEDDECWVVNKLLVDAMNKVNRVSFMLGVVGGDEEGKSRWY